MSNTTSHASFDPSVTTWWGAQPATRAPTHVPAPILAPPNAFGCSVLMVAGLLLTPFALVCWLYASDQLAKIDGGELSSEGRSTIAFARGVGAFVTMLAVAAIVAYVAITNR